MNFKDIFVKNFDNVKKDVLDSISCYHLPKNVVDDVIKYYDKCLSYNCTGGKMTRGVAILEGVYCIKKEQENSNDFTLPDHLLHQCIILGWCVELLQVFFLIADDIMDRSELRRGLPCWYKVQNVTDMNAINDTIFLNSSIFLLLKKYFYDNKELFAELVSMFAEITNTTVIGQHLDSNNNFFPKEFCHAIVEDPSNSKITMDRYRSIVWNKTAYYTFYLPTILVMIISGLKDQSLIKMVEKVCVRIGEYFQVQDDYLDCYGDSKIMGKEERDIEEGKMTWLLVKAYNKADYSQRKRLYCNYGICAEKSLLVKKVYEELKIQDDYHEYEEESKKDIEKMIAEVDNVGLQNLLRLYFQKIHHRKS